MRVLRDSGTEENERVAGGIAGRDALGKPEGV
jgi:hypothetical protein